MTKFDFSNLIPFKKKKAAPPKSKLREWVDSIVFAVIAATLLRWLIMSAFVIPTSSMESSLLVGDYLFVSKMHYGARTPITPLQMPLTHQKIWGTNIPSYLEWLQLPQFRLPGLGDVERNEPVVFNVPPQHLNEGIDYPLDLKTYYVKRCVGLPGDDLKIENKQIFINGKPSENPEKMQFSYLVFAKSTINDRLLKKEKIAESRLLDVSDESAVYFMQLNSQQVNSLKNSPFILEVREASTNEYNQLKPYQKGEPDEGIFTKNSKLFPWNGDWFGPLTIPKKGTTITIDKSTLTLYGDVIKLYDHNENVNIDGDKLTIDGKEVKEYTFKQDYYFMMGDNRHNSLDSRYWGFVPEDHVLGKPLFVWMSIDQNESFLSKIRWKRIFMGID